MIRERSEGVVIMVLFYRMKKKITILNQASPHFPGVIAFMGSCVWS
jgi:hypothetical protein